jgi:hypothetical protein
MQINDIEKQATHLDSVKKEVEAKGTRQIVQRLRLKLQG